MRGNRIKLSPYSLLLPLLLILMVLLYWASISLKPLLVIAAMAYALLHYKLIPVANNKVLDAIRNNKILKLAWGLLFASIFLWRARSSGDLIENPVDITGFVRIVEVSAAGFIALIMLRRKAIYHLFSSVFLMLALYCVLAIISGCYSSFPLYTIYKAVEITTALLVAVAILGRCTSFDEIRDYMNISLAIFLVMIISVWLGVFLNPGIALRKTYHMGVFGFLLTGVVPVLNANSVGFIAGLIATAAFCRSTARHNSNDNVLYRSIFLLALGTLILSQARTSFFGFLVAILLWLVLNKRMKWLMFFGFLAIFLSINLITKEFLIDYFRRGSTDELFYSLSGRTAAWEHAWEMFKKAPFLGYGFASGARFDVLRGNVISLHGAFFDVLINLGLLGLIFWLFVIMGTWVQLLQVFVHYSSIMPSKVKLFHTEVISILSLLTCKAFTSSAVVMHGMEFLIFLIILSYAQLSAKSKGFMRNHCSEGRIAQD